MDISTIITICGLISTIAGSFFVTKWRLDRYDRDQIDERDNHVQESDHVWSEITKLRDWRMSHTLEMEKRFTDILVSMADTTSKFSTIIESYQSLMSRLDKIEDKIDNLEDRKKRS